MWRRSREYPRVAVTVFRAPNNDRLMSQYDAARELGISVYRVGWLVACEHLTGVGYEVTTESVHAELAWRQSASIASKCGRLLRDIVSFV